MTAVVLILVTLLVFSMLGFLVIIVWRDGGPLATILVMLVVIFTLATFPYKSFVDLVVSLF